MGGTGETPIANVDTTVTMTVNTGTSLGKSADADKTTRRSAARAA